MYLQCGAKQPGRDPSGCHKNVGHPGTIHDADATIEFQTPNEIPTAKADDGKHRHRSPRGQAAQDAVQAHSSAFSRHAYSTPSRRMTMNMSISTNATIPSRRKTTAHGYMKTISMSNARNNSAIA